MFFNLQYVENHPLYELQEALTNFFQRCASDLPYDLDCFPDWFAEVIRRSSKSKMPKLSAKFDLIARIIQSQDDPAVRQSIFTVFDNNNCIRDLCEDKDYNLDLLNDITITIEEVEYTLSSEIKDLFDYLFDNVLERKNLFNADKDFSIRHHHEQFRKLNGDVCPFCGMEIYPDLHPVYEQEIGAYIDKTDKRSNYDHYLAKTIYPLAAVNFRNLIPMCESCNESPNKGATDILFTTNERLERRQVFYPYAENEEAQLTVECLEMTIENRFGIWQVEITPLNNADAEKVESWKSIFKISTRIANRVRRYNSTWLRHFLGSLSAEQQCDINILREKLKDEAENCGKLKKTLRDGVVMEAYFKYLAESAPDEEVVSFCDILGSGFMKTFIKPTEAAHE